jgi:hypothetical protein
MRTFIPAKCTIGLCFALLFFSARLPAQSILQDKDAFPVLQRSLAQVYNYEFYNALTTIKPVRARYPYHPVIQIFDCLFVYWKSFPVSLHREEYQDYKKRLA